MTSEAAIVYLVGFMGAGKSSVGARLAELLGWRFVDLDGRIEERAGESIRELFRREGEPYFRMLEREELRRVSSEREAVVALGGGTFCSPENQAIVRSTGASVYLEAPADLLYERCSGWDGRPLFTTLEAMRELLERRRPFYEQAHLTVPVSNLSVDDVARWILAALRGEAS